VLVLQDTLSCLSHWPCWFWCAM